MPDEVFSITEVLNNLRTARISGNGSAHLNMMEVDSLLEYIEASSGVNRCWEESLRTDPEDFRREKPSLDATPVRDKSIASDRRSSTTSVYVSTVDYGSAGNLLDRAIHHLDEALPTGQKRRAELAFAMLRQGCEELGVWLRAKGYKV